MKELTKLVADLSTIERVLLTCHGPERRSALIKSRAGTAYTLTSDGQTILAGLDFARHNPLVKLALGVVARHSDVYGDNCKLLFVYLCQGLALVERDDDRPLLVAQLRSLSLACFSRDFLAELERRSGRFRKIKDAAAAELAEFLPQLCVMYDLNEANSTFASLCRRLTIGFIRAHLAVEPGPNLRATLEHVELDFSHSLFYSQVSSLEESCLLADGFLLQGTHLLAADDDRLQRPFRAVLLYLEDAESPNRSTPSEIELEIRSNIGRALADLIDASQLPRAFLDALVELDVRLVVCTAQLSGAHRSQLRMAGCSVVLSVPHDYLLHLSRALGVDPVYFDSSRLSVRHLVHLSSIRSLSRDLSFLELAETHRREHPESRCRAAIFFASPIRTQYHQFRLHFLKVIRALKVAFDSATSTETGLFIPCDVFESLASECARSQLEASTLHSGWHLRFVQRLLDLVDVKLHHGRRLREHTSTLVNTEPRYDPLALKTRCLFEALHFLKRVLNIDQIVCLTTSKRLKSLQPDSSDDDDD